MFLTIRDALSQGQRLLEGGGDAVPRLTAEVLLCHALGRERSYLYAHPEEPLSELAWIHYGRYLHQRLGGRPTQHITGRQEFYGRMFRVSRDVLIPRPETEHLVEAALPHCTPDARVLDVGTGSGAIAVTLAYESRARVAATDVSAAALAMARRNAAALGAAVALVQADLTMAVAVGSVDVLVSNPPYVAEEDAASLAAEVRDYEPHGALFAGRDGLAVYRRLVPEAARVLRPGGWLLLELGAGQREAVAGLLGEGWDSVRAHQDYAGIARVLEAQWQGRGRC